MMWARLSCSLVLAAATGAELAIAAEFGPAKATLIEDGAPAGSVMPGAPPITLNGCDFSKAPDAKQGEAIVRKVAHDEAFDPDLLLAIARQESGFRMNSVSGAGAVGLMQLMPATAKRFSVDICDPEDNVRGAVRYLRVLQGRYQNPIYVLAAYDAGENAVEQNRGIPPYPETVRYVETILTDLYGWKPFAAPSSGDGAVAKPKDEPGKREAWTQGFVLHVEY
jgi:soluble lytic murein transglycosylase-like protein